MDFFSLQEWKVPHTNPIAVSANPIKQILLDKEVKDVNLWERFLSLYSW